jgi:hypothetical protein
MSNIDFTYFYKTRYLNTSEIEPYNYDIAITTYGDTDRVREVFNSIQAKEKYLFILPEYQNELFPHTDNNTHCINVPYSNGYEAISSFIDSLSITQTTKICLDMTGFIVPHLLYTIRYLQKKKNVTSLDVFYSEPQKYKDEENTKFSDLYVDVAQILGYGGTPNPTMDNDLLIIASGYDDSRITDVASKKKHVKNKIQLFGFPSLQADMFQENMLRAYKAESSVGNDGFKNMELNLYAPANDPFVAAQIIQQYIEKEERSKPFSNIYFAPLSSKPHALGMALYCLWKNVNGDKSISIIYPLCDRYFGDNSVGISKIWKYQIVLPSNNN